MRDERPHVTTVLVVCTANVCRSPMAAGLLAAHLEAVGSPTRVSSAGAQAMPSGVAREAVAVMADRGIDISAHAPRLLARGDVETADLVVAMECAHVAHIVALDAEAFTKTFCARELVERAERVGPRRLDEALGGYLGRAHRGRRANDVLRSSAEFDVIDPMGQPRDAFEKCAKELDELMGSIAGLVA